MTRADYEYMQEAAATTTASAMAEHIGCSIETVRQTCAAMGWAIKPSPWYLKNRGVNCQKQAGTRAETIRKRVRATSFIRTRNAPPPRLIRERPPAVLSTQEKIFEKYGV